VSLSALDQTFETESTLKESLPWLPLVVSGAANRSFVECLESLSAKDRRLISSELKSAWTLAEGIRSSFKVLVDDFIRSDSKRIRLGIFTRYDLFILSFNSFKCLVRAQQVTDEILVQFSFSSTKDTSYNTTVNLELMKFHLCNEVKRETWTYLHIMNGVVEFGESFLSGKS
jgi:hypothetical protein